MRRLRRNKRMLLPSHDASDSRGRGSPRLAFASRSDAATCDRRLAAARLTRRALFSRAAQGIGGVALASLFGMERSKAGDQPSGALGAPHHAPKAKKVIYL